MRHVIVLQRGKPLLIKKPKQLDHKHHMVLHSVHKRGGGVANMDKLYNDNWDQSAMSRLRLDSIPFRDGLLKETGDAAGYREIEGGAIRHHKKAFKPLRLKF
jgi:hypothetical protein